MSGCQTSMSRAVTPPYVENIRLWFTGSLVPVNSCHCHVNVTISSAPRVAIMSVSHAVPFIHTLVVHLTVAPVGWSMSLLEPGKIIRDAVSVPSGAVAYLSVATTPASFCHTDFSSCSLYVMRLYLAERVGRDAAVDWNA